MPLTGPIEVDESEGRFTNRFEAILGADNKAAVAAFMGVARRFAVGRAGRDRVPLHDVRGGRARRARRRSTAAGSQADYGFVFDHASPIGELIVAAPSYFRVEAEFHGRAAHAGIRPEDGRSAIVGGGERARTGWSSAASTTRRRRTPGRIEGGTAANVVPERCRVELEARSVDPDKATRVVERMVDALTDAASDAECDVETHIEEQFRAYRMSRTAPLVETAAAALDSARDRARVRDDRRRQRRERVQRRRACPA